MTKAKNETQTKVSDFDLSRMKKNVEGEGSDTAITLTGPTSPAEIYKVLTAAPFTKSK